MVRTGSHEQASTYVFVKLVGTFDFSGNSRTLPLASRDKQLARRSLLPESHPRGHRSRARTTVFQTVDEGAIPSVRTAQPQRSELSRLIYQEELRPFFRADSPGRIAVCNTAREGSTPSRLSRSPSRGRPSPRADHDGLVTLDSLIRSPHCVRFADDPPRCSLPDGSEIANAQRSAALAV
jgi:hypothetical protein